MSFGFSISDILMLSQLSYKLFGLLTADRQSAPTTLRQLSTSVYGLRCALEHLSRYLAASNPPPGTHTMHTSINLLMANCGATLKELEDVLEVYEGKVVVRGKGVKGKAVREWNRVKWAVEEKGLVDIRLKIAQHTESIGMVVNTFILVEIRDGRDEMRGETARMEELLEKLVTHGNDMKQTSQKSEKTVKDLVDQSMGEMNNMKEMIIGAINPSVFPSPPLPHGPGPQALGVVSAQPLTQPPRIAAVAMVQPTAQPAHMKGSSSQASGMTSLEEINRQRAATAKRPSKPLISGQSSAPPPKRQNHDPPPSQLLSLRPPAMANRGEEIRHLAPEPLSQSTRATSSYPWLTKCEVAVWSWRTAPGSATKEEIKSRTSVAVNLLRELNAYLEGLDSKEQRRRYRAGLEGEQFEMVLQNMKLFSKGSVVLRKQIEIYEDDKEEDEAR